MQVGIDVGGTYTDGVVFAGGEILRWVKEPTDTENLQGTILAVLDNLLKKDEAAKIDRLVLSTTLVTNIVATGRVEKVALLVLPGPGLNPNDLNLPGEFRALRGAIDFRGREIEPIDRKQVIEAGKEIAALGIKKVAVVGKFCQRNQAQEEEVIKILSGRYPEMEFLAGHQVSGRLNFPRRAVTTYYTLATRDAWQGFANEIAQAISKRGIKVTAEIMKADGGTMSIESSMQEPCQSVFSGPAASTMGAFALTMDNETSVVVDIGGTTTDLAFLLAGKPLYASRGATIEERYTQIQALAVRSIALGGDSVVRLDNGKLLVGPDRMGPAACFGGPVATPTDAFNIISNAGLGEVEKSRQALAKIAPEGEAGVKKLSEEIVKTFVDLLQENVTYMLKAWEEEPAYKVWEIVNRRKASLDRVVGIGAAAPAFVPILAERMGCKGLVHKYSPVANALGAAVARPTLQLTVHVDTQAGSLSVDGAVGKVPAGGRLQLTDIKKIAEQELKKAASSKGLEDYVEEREFFLEEQFNVVRGWSTTGKIFDVGIGISPGVIAGFKGVKA